MRLSIRSVLKISLCSLVLTSLLIPMSVVRAQVSLTPGLGQDHASQPTDLIAKQFTGLSLEPSRLEAATESGSSITLSWTLTNRTGQTHQVRPVIKDVIDITKDGIPTFTSVEDSQYSKWLTKVEVYDPSNKLVQLSESDLFSTLATISSDNSLSYKLTFKVPADIKIRGNYFGVFFETVTQQKLQDVQQPNVSVVARVGGVVALTISNLEASQAIKLGVSGFTFGGQNSANLGQNSASLEVSNTNPKASPGEPSLSSGDKNIDQSAQESQLVFDLTNIDNAHAKLHGEAWLQDLWGSRDWQSPTTQLNQEGRWLLPGKTLGASVTAEPLDEWTLKIYGLHLRLGLADQTWTERVIPVIYAGRLLTQTAVGVFVILLSGVIARSIYFRRHRHFPTLTS